MTFDVEIRVRVIVTRIFRECSSSDVAIQLEVVLEISDIIAMENDSPLVKE